MSILLSYINYGIREKASTLSPTRMTNFEVNSEVGELTSKLDAMHKDHGCCFKQQTARLINSLSK